MKCCAYQCDSDSSKKIPGVTFHRFPKDEKIRKAWINNAQVQPKIASHLCSKHFEEHLIDPSAFRTRLRPGSIPTLFNELPPVIPDKENVINPQKNLPIERTVAEKIVSELKEHYTPHKMIPAPVFVACDITAIKIDEENLPGPSNCISTPPSITPVRPSIPPVRPSIAPVRPSIPPVRPLNAPVRPSIPLVRPSIPPVTPSIPPATLSIHPVTPSISPVRPSMEQIIPTKLEERLRRKLIHKNKKIKLLQQQCRRLKKTVSQLTDLIAKYKNELKDDKIYVIVQGKL